MITWKTVLSYVQRGNPVPDRKVLKSEDEWRDQLTSSQYSIMRKKATEAPGTGDLCEHFDTGVYACAGCHTSLFDSTIKFESGTGWPSFTQPITENAISYIKDDAFGMIRVEVLCNVCDSHLGHVFPDGPEPSGLRYCVNSESLELLT